MRLTNAAAGAICKAGKAAARAASAQAQSRRHCRGRFAATAVAFREAVRAAVGFGPGPIPAGAAANPRVARRGDVLGLVHEPKRPRRGARGVGNAPGASKVKVQSQNRRRSQVRLVQSRRDGGRANPLARSRAKLAEKLALRRVRFACEREETTGYCWVSHLKTWRISMRWRGEVIHFGYMDDEDSARTCGRTLVAFRDSLSKKRDNFKCVSVRGSRADATSAECWVAASSTRSLRGSDI